MMEAKKLVGLLTRRLEIIRHGVQAVQEVRREASKDARARMAAHMLLELWMAEALSLTDRAALICRRCGMKDRYRALVRQRRWLITERDRYYRLRRAAEEKLCGGTVWDG